MEEIFNHHSSSSSVGILNQNSIISAATQQPYGIGTRRKKLPHQATTPSTTTRRRYYYQHRGSDGGIGGGRFIGARVARRSFEDACLSAPVGTVEINSGASMMDQQQQTGASVLDYRTVDEDYNAMGGGRWTFVDYLRREYCYCRLCYAGGASVNNNATLAATLSASIGPSATRQGNSCHRIFSFKMNFKPIPTYFSIRHCQLRLPSFIAIGCRRSDSSAVSIIVDAHS